MTTIYRSNALFVAEDWIRIYEAIQNVDFRAYDMDNYVDAIMFQLQINHPDEFNDWIASSEFVMKVEVLAWLSQNISFRVDLNSRENFLATAERRDSLIRLAQNIAYKVSRVRSASGDVKIVEISTGQALVDSDGNNLQNRAIVWNDPKNENWYEQFITVMNAALAVRTPFGKPVAQYRAQSNRTDEYIFNSISPENGSYAIKADVNGVTLPFDLYNASLDTETGEYQEFIPGQNTAMRVFFRQDGKGFGSAGTGFFFPIKQGTISSQIETFDDAVVNRTITLSAQNVNQDDVFLQQIDQNSNVIANWEKVDTVFGEGVSFNPDSTDPRNVFEVDTLSNDRIRIRFGDGKFGAIPLGTFRFWLRTANPQPLLIKAPAIQGQTITVPYVVNSDIQFLRIRFSLTQTLTNAAASETNAEIRARANKVYYTQNRMVNNEDYNNFYLKDTAVRKVKAVNRTYAGHSRYAKLHDPTGLYENVKVIGDDGRLYQSDTSNFQLITADTDRLTHKGLIDQFLKPAIRKQDKRLLYYGRYNEFEFQRTIIYTWKETSRVGNQSLGNIMRGTTPVPVGPGTTNIFQYITTDTVFRYNSRTGPLGHIIRVIDDGSAPNGIILGGIVPDGARLYAVFPPFRDRLTRDEEVEIIKRLSLRTEFGLSWNQVSQKWQVIDFPDLDKTGPFSLAHQSDLTSAHLDASWMVRFEYIPDAVNGDKWQMADRGLGLFFESARDVDFYYSNTRPVIDPDTGLVVQDTVRLLASNESKSSFRRRGLEPIGVTRCDQIAYTDTGDGVQTCFRTSETPIDPAQLVVTLNGVLQILGIDYTISRAVDGDSICFTVAPPAGARIEIRLSNSFINGEIRAFVYAPTTGQHDFDLFVQTVDPANMFVFADGVLQVPSRDFGTARMGANASLVFGPNLDTGVILVAQMISGYDSPSFNADSFTGNGTTTNFVIQAPNQTANTLLITLDGVLQNPTDYTILSDNTGTRITFVTAPSANVRIVIRSVAVPAMTRTNMYTFDANGTQTVFPLSNNSGLLSRNAIVAIEGICQVGSYASSFEWQITGGNLLSFNSPPLAGKKITVFVIAGSVGTKCDRRDEFLDLISENPSNEDGNVGSIDESSCMVHFLGRDIDLWSEDILRDDDGYPNTNGLIVKPADNDHDGFYDNPFLFRDLVIEDGTTDLVLWRRTELFGKDVWDPINRLTVPHGTYGLSSQGKPAAGFPLADDVLHGDIHYDIFTNKWLVANTISGFWELAPDQNAFRKMVGRDQLRFMWLHYSPDNNRIDPSPGNIHDVFLLTATYDDAYRSWIANNGRTQDEPQAPTSEALRIQFSEFNEFKMLSDSLIYHSARYKPLFGPQAVPELQATFKLIQSPGSTISENDLKLRVLNRINEFFDISLWEFGEKFYFTELSGYIHSKLAPDIQSFVIVPKASNQAFGRLFEVRCESDQLFISTAGPDDIEIVSSLTDQELRVGVYTG